jgi:hypothetical protein
MVTRDNFIGDKVAKHEADHSPPSSVKVELAIPPLPHVFVA